MAHMASTSALLALQQQQAAALHSLNRNPFDVLAPTGALTGVAAMAAALERQAQVAQSMQAAACASTARNAATAAAGTTYSTAQSQHLSASALHNSSVHELSTLPARAAPGYDVSMSALMANRPAAGTMLTQQAAFAAAAAGYQPAGQAPAARLPVMTRTATRIPKLGTVQTYNPATGVRTLTGAAAMAAAANGAPAAAGATAAGAVATSPFVAQGQQLQAANQQQLLTAAVAAAQQQQQQLFSAMQSVGAHNSNFPLQACMLAEQLASLSGTGAALNSSLAQLLFGDGASTSASSMPLLPAAWPAGLNANLPTPAAPGSGTRPGTAFNLNAADNGADLGLFSEAEDSEDLSSLLHCIGTELARHGISVAAAIEAGWVGHVSPASAAAIEQAHAAETDRLQLRRTLGASQASSLGPKQVNMAAGALSRSACASASLGAPLSGFPGSGSAWYDDSATPGILHREDPDSVLGAMSQVFTPSGSCDEPPKKQATTAAAAAAAANWGRAPGICPSISLMAGEVPGSPSAAQSAKEALGTWAASLSEASAAAALRDVAAFKREGASRPHLSTLGAALSDFYPTGLITAPSGSSIDDLASAGNGAPDSGSSNVMSLYSGRGSVSPDTTVHGTYGGALDLMSRFGEAGAKPGPGSYDLPARLANLNLGLGFM